jgi:hypothetical protein
MNKNLVLISSIGLFLEDVHKPLRKFLASHIVSMRPCKTSSMGQWLLRQQYLRLFSNKMKVATTTVFFQHDTSTEKNSYVSSYSNSDC